MMGRKPVGWLSLALVLSSCGSGGGGGGTASSGPIASVPPPVTASDTCSLRSRQDWAAAELREWYLFPETLPASLDPSPYATVEDYIDALTATARAQGRDRFFTFLTSIAEENAFNNSGTSAGFGVRLALDASGRLFITESFEGAPALAAGIDRGTEILAIGTSSATLQSVSALLAAGGTQALNDALGPNNAGTARVLRVSDASGTRDVTLTKASFDLQPVSSRYGAKVIVDGGRKVGYINLRTFILSANQPLQDAFAQFGAQGITDVIVDMRYNGGGLISVAESFGDLLGRNRAPGDVFDTLSFRPEKAANNTTHFFTPPAQAIAPTHIAFIATGGTASASELMINGMLPYLHANEALIGTNTFGKPVGQIAVDQPACDDRFRIIAFALQNAAHQGDYFAGLASRMDASCQAADDIGHPMGDPNEASTRAALNFIEGVSCAPITASAGGIATQAVREAPRELLTPAQPTVVQRNLPGSF
jgi:C-terminal processing protease CtpA/Prc